MTLGLRLKTGDKQTAVVLFDGVCNLCNWSVDFILKNDGRRKFKFAAIQSNVGQQLIREAELEPQKFNSVILIVNGHVYQKSTATLMIAKKLNFPWFLFSVFMLVPQMFRDSFYDYIAGKRYAWFGKRKSCRIPTREESGRFLR